MQPIFRYTKLEISYYIFKSVHNYEQLGKIYWFTWKKMAVTPEKGYNSSARLLPYLL